MSISNSDSHAKNSAKRPRHSSPPLPGTLATSPEVQGAAEPNEWSLRISLFTHHTRILWLNLCNASLPTEWSPDIWEDLEASLTLINQIAADLKSTIDCLHTVHYPDVSPTGQATPPPGDVQLDTSDQPAPKIPPPTKSYARAVGPGHRTPQAARQATAKPQPKKAGPLPKVPVHVVLQLEGLGPVPAHDLPPPELFWQLSESIANSHPAGSAQPMGTQWNRKGNLILAFPPGTSRTSIKSVLPAISSTLCLAERPNVIFDVPWAKVHLANIPARHTSDSPLFSEDLLQRTLALNPAIQDLRIT